MTLRLMGRPARVQPFSFAIFPTWAKEIQLLACGYSAQCSVRSCHTRATTIARYIDDGGAPLRQRELCDRHAAWLKANRPNIYDMRSASDG